MADEVKQELREIVAIELFKADCPNGLWDYAVEIQRKKWMARADEILAKAEPLIRQDERERIESCFDCEPTHCTFVKTQCVEECHIIKVKDWQALKGEGKAKNSHEQG